MTNKRLTFDNLNGVQKKIAIAYLDAFMDKESRFNTAKLTLYFKGDDPEMTEEVRVNIDIPDTTGKIADNAHSLIGLLELADPDNETVVVIVDIHDLGYIPVDGREK